MGFYPVSKRLNMYAVIKTGGKQYRVAAGEKIKVEQIAADIGQQIVLDQILAVGNGSDISIGTPLVSGAAVTVTVLAQGRHDKVRIFKMRRRKHYQKRQGHRQNYTELLIAQIADGKGGVVDAPAVAAWAPAASQPSAEADGAVSA
jgi:large subunit ribosomal protein L21